MSDISNFLDEKGRLIRFPAKHRMKLYALHYLIGKFDPERKYTEKEVNELLEQWHTFHDPATLRRELYNKCLLNRKQDCSAYWVKLPTPTIEELLAKYI